MTRTKASPEMDSSGKRSAVCKIIFITHNYTVLLKLTQVEFSIRNVTAEIEQLLRNNIYSEGK